MSALVVVTASGLAREVLAVVSALGTFTDVVVVDDDPRLWGIRVAGAPVIGGLDLVVRHPDHRVVVCAGQGSARRAIVERLLEFGVTSERYATVVAPSSPVPTECTVGAGSVVLASVVMTADVNVGRHVVLMPRVTLTHDDQVDEFATLCAGVTLGGGVTVGSGAYLGMSSAVRERVRVGRNSVLGMGAALVQDLPDNQTWVGVPARPLASRADTPASYGHVGAER